MRDVVRVPVLELNGIARRFGHRWALRGVDLRADASAVIALRGRNGSGKTTLLRVCATLLRPTRGIGRMAGFDLVGDAARVRPLVGFLAHRPGLYDDLTAIENLRFAARMTGVPHAPAALGAILERTGLGREANERVRGFSAGMRRRLALGRLFLRHPSLLLLDEPYASFDEDGVQLVNEFAAEVARAGGIVLIATHDTMRGRGIVSREVVLQDGRLSESAPAIADRSTPSPGASRVPS